MKSSNARSILMFALLSGGLQAQVLSSSTLSPDSGTSPILNASSRKDFKTADCDLPAQPAILARQNLTDLSGNSLRSAETKSPRDTIDFTTSPFRKIPVNSPSSSLISSNALGKSLAAAYETYQHPDQRSANCHQIAKSIATNIEETRGELLNIVSREVSANPSCACEIVKSAIKASAADAETVAAIVESAVLAQPEQIRLISQCAVAVAPEALSAVQAVLSRHDPHAGASISAKSAKNGGLVATAAKPQSPNPLDRLFIEWGLVDPPRGDFTLIPNLPPIITPPVVVPPEVTDVN